jgi:hypothetical protein
LGRQPHRIDAAQKLPAEPEAAGKAQDDRRPDRPAESRENAAQGFVRAPPLIADDQS